MHFRPFQQDLGTKLAQSLESARVPIERGTLVVFSNYQLVHRVLRMELQKAKNAGAQAGHRDFLAFFVIDQRHPLQSTANRPGDYEKPIETHSFRKDPKLCSDSEEEVDDEVGDATKVATAAAAAAAAAGGVSEVEGSSSGSGKDARSKPNQVGGLHLLQKEMVQRRSIRDNLLKEQLQPAGRFGSAHNIVYSTGNGSAAYVGFLNQGRVGAVEQDGGSSSVPAAAQDDPAAFVPDDDGSSLLESGILLVERSLNITPPVLGRGLSWARGNEQASLFNPQSRWHELRIVDGATGEAVEWLYTSYLPYEVKRVRRNIDRPWAEGVSSFSEEVRGIEGSQLDTPSQRGETL